MEKIRARLVYADKLSMLIETKFLTLILMYPGIK
jgi:hypothetical protein